MIIDLYDTKSIAAGNTYTQDYLPGTGLSQAQLAYTDEPGIAYVSASTLLNPAAQSTVTISELTSTYMKGTFSGKLLTEDYTGINIPLLMESFM